MQYPKIGIRPVIDGRWGGVRESLETQTMGMANTAKALIEGSVRYPDGTPVQCVVSKTTIGGGAEAAACAAQFAGENVVATLSVTPCWCYGAETMDMDPMTIKAVWGFNGTERPGAVYLAAVMAAYAQKGLPAFSIYGRDVQDMTDPRIPADVAEKILRFARCAVSVGWMKNKAYVNFGGVAMGIAGSYCNADMFQKFFGIRAEWVDMTEILRRIRLEIYDPAEYEKAGRIDLAILCLQKSNAIRMVRPNLGYRKSDYYRLVKTLAFYGRVDEAYAEKEKIDRYFEKKAAESAPNEVKRVLELAKTLGTDLVEMSCHGCVCSECAKYQGRVFSLSGKDRRFPKIPDAFFEYGGIHEGCSHTFSPCYGNTDALFYDNTLRYYPTIKKKYQKDIITFSNRPFVDDRPPEDIEKAVEVQKKAELRWERESKLLTAEYVIEREVKRGQDMRDFQWIQDNLPDICPKSLTGYRRMKNQNTKNYRKIVEAARAMGYEIT